MLPDPCFSDDLIWSACFGAPPPGAGSSKRLIERADGIGRAGAWTIFISEPAALGIYEPLKVGKILASTKKMGAGCFRDQACHVECWKNKSRGRNTSGPVEVESFLRGSPVGSWA
jgi:hypothetical protein